jgi:regulator of protease activity HflC (stomatin/prohibitin superfamily)
MAAAGSVEERLARLRELVLNARSMPMSASCVINRTEVLEAIDAVVQHLPDEFVEAQRVIDQASAKIAEGEAEARRLVEEARSKVSELAEDSEVVHAAEAKAAAITAEAESEAAALRRETDVFIDARMASFESVLHKTASQVRTARLRLSERSSLD